MSTSVRVVCFAILLKALCNAFGTDIQSGPKSIPELQTAIQTVLKETRTPGAAIAIVSRDKEEWVAGLGTAEVAAHKPVTAETLFRIGSVTKAFAALAALKLQEEGKLKLTDTVRSWVPEVAFANPWETSDPVRLVHLMEHTTGFDDCHPREYALNDPTPIALKDALAYGADARISRWRPGTRAAYCNSGPAVLAAVIERVSGQRFEDYVREHFFKPLHMDSASYFYTPEVEQRLTKLYRSDGITPFPYWHIHLRPAGSINASAKDMANYVRFHLQRGRLDGRQLLRASSIERMEKMETLPSARLGNVAGFGLYNYPIFEGPFVFRGHNGGVYGGLTEMAYLPGEGRGYAFMINSGNHTALRRIAALVREYVIRDLTPPAWPPAASVPAEIQQHYAGYYQGISPRMQLFYPFERVLNIKKLVFTADGLSVTTRDLRRQQWVPMTQRLFRRQDQSAATLALLTDADGETLIQSDTVADNAMPFGTYKKVPGLWVWGQRAAIGLTLLLMLSAPLFALVWGLRKLSGKLPDAGPLSVRLMPLLSTLLLIGFVGLFVFSKKKDGLYLLGECSLLTVSIMLLSIAFPLAAAASLYIVYRERSTAMNRMAYWHSALIASAMVAVALYMGYWRMIGLRLWD